MSVNEKLQEFLKQGAIGAFSGGSKVLELIGEGKSHLIGSYLDQIRNCGDNENVRGNVDVVYELERTDLFAEQSWIYTETNAFLDIPLEFDEVSEVELFIQLSKGIYQIELKMKINDPKGDHYDADIYHNTGNILRYGYGYAYDDKMIFEVSDLEEGICRIDIYTKRDKGTIQEVKISPWKHQIGRAHV